MSRDWGGHSTFRLAAQHVITRVTMSRGDAGVVPAAPRGGGLRQSAGGGSFHCISIESHDAAERG